MLAKGAFEDRSSTLRLALTVWLAKQSNGPQLIRLLTLYLNELDFLATRPVPNNSKIVVRLAPHFLQRSIY
jgi:hypothetical protein